MQSANGLGWVKALALILGLGLLAPAAWSKEIRSKEIPSQEVRSLDLARHISAVERDNAQILTTLGRGARAQAHAGGLSLKLKKKKKSVRKSKHSRKVRA